LAALKSYRCQYTVDHDGDALHLVDVLSAGETIAEGQREIELLAEHLSLAIDESNAASEGSAGSAVDSMCREKMGHGNNPHWCCLPKGHDGQHSCGVCALLWDTPSGEHQPEPASGDRLHAVVGTPNQKGRTE